jgi:SOS-response transcriptional repressor LexA
MNAITQKQKEVLDFIVLYVRTKDRPPTTREICEKKRYNSTNSAMTHIVALCKKGYLHYNGSCSCRTKISLTEKTRREYGFYDSGKHAQIVDSVLYFCDHYQEDEEFNRLPNSKSAVHWAMMRVKNLLRT